MVKHICVIHEEQDPSVADCRAEKKKSLICVRPWKVAACHWPSVDGPIVLMWQKAAPYTESCFVYRKQLFSLQCCAIHWTIFCMGNFSPCVVLQVCIVSVAHAPVVCLVLKQQLFPCAKRLFCCAWSVCLSIVTWQVPSGSLMACLLSAIKLQKETDVTVCCSFSRNSLASSTNYFRTGHK